ncbi:murein transglycosylase A [Pelagerythrobacter marensis]|uniref:peptidoglycan lytic exotransglycosylase n=1 Tax=Pelagerythrobacter marensis TaxID=543877 RepID=A0ABZ2D5U9_9SPHN
MRRWGFLAALAALLTSCTIVPRGEAPRPAGPGVVPPSGVASAAFAGVAAGPDIAALPIAESDAGTALAAFLESCPRLLGHPDASGLTYPEDWRPACDAARTWPYNRGREFFARFFETARVGDGAAFATGYFEPEIRGSRTRRPGYEVPVYGLPPDLVRAWPKDVPESERTGRPPLGRYDAAGNFVLYYDRAQIEAGALAGRGLEIAWAADPVELFFLQIQGSGRVALPDGGVMRIGYAGQNGREYVGIGRIMRERGLIGDGPGQYPGSMQGIMAYIRENPEEGRALMQLNKSWVFFRELTGDGPLGSIGVPVRRESSVAVDPAFVPYGAPVWLEVDRPEANGLWVAQDTGGAIKGPNRFDTFWGAGADARTIAGGMSAHGRALILLPRGTVARLNRR